MQLAEALRRNVYRDGLVAQGKPEAMAEYMIVAHKLLGAQTFEQVAAGAVDFGPVSILPDEMRDESI